jgi:putative transposase
MRLLMPTRVPLQHTPPAFVPEGSWFFVTICCHQRGANQLAVPIIGRGLLADAIHYHRSGVWNLHLMLLMPDHLHAILAVGCGGGLSETIRNWKRMTARMHGVRWQRNFFDHRLRAGESLDLKARYIRENPVRAGLVSRAEN